MHDLLPDDINMEPECFTGPEWLAVVDMAREADPYLPIIRFTREFVMRKACEDCNLIYQSIEAAHGRCHPPSGAMTPLLRAEAGVDDLADD